MAQLLWNAPRIDRIQIEIPNNPLRNLNIYVIRDGEEALIVDAGLDLPSCRAQFWTQWDKLGLSAAHTRVFLTHYHADHIGLVWDFVRRKVPILAGAEEVQYFSHWSGEALRQTLSGQFARAGFPEQRLEEAAFQGLPMPKTDFPVCPMEDGQVFSVGSTRVQVLWMPGHTPGNAVLYLPREQILFSGDHVLFDITPNIGIWPGVKNPLGDYRRSLQKAAALPVRLALPAHREPGADFHGRIQAVEAHHVSRLEEIRRVLEQDIQASAYTVASRLHWSDRGLGWDRFPAAQQWFAMAETMAHLVELHC